MADGLANVSSRARTVTAAAIARSPAAARVPCSRRTALALRTASGSSELFPALGIELAHLPGEVHERDVAELIDKRAALTLVSTQQGSLG